MGVNAGWFGESSGAFELEVSNHVVELSNFPFSNVLLPFLWFLCFFCLFEFVELTVPDLSVKTKWRVPSLSLSFILY